GSTRSAELGERPKFPGRSGNGETRTWQERLGASGFTTDHAQRGSDGQTLEPDRALDRNHELIVQVVAGIAGDDMADHGSAQECEVTNQVEDLVAHELVAIAQAVERASLANHDGIVERSAARESVLS